jgi:peptide/nickel transport system substrate-binding protein
MDLGPYKLTEWVRTAGKDDRIVLEANPYYWNASGGYPKTDKIIYEFYADSTGLRLAIEIGDIDIAFRHLSPDDLIDLQADPNLKVWQGAGAFIQYMIFQEAEIPGLRQLNDSRIRRAITAALNRSEVCQTIFLNQSQPLYSMIPMGMTGHTEAFRALGDANYTYTQSLLAQLGYNDTNKLEIELWYESSGHYPSSDLQAAIYKSQLEASGVISVTLESADWPSYRLNRNNGIMHVFVYGWYPDYVDPDNYAFLYWAPWLNHQYSTYGVHYQDMVDAYNDARNTTDAATRISLYAQLEQYAVEDCPVIPIFQGSAWAVSKTDVEGIVLDISQAWRNWLIIPEFTTNLLAILLVMTAAALLITRKLVAVRKLR